MKWVSVNECLPKQNRPVMTKIDDERGVRNQQPLVYSDGLWFFLDKSMYVYYTPTHWCNL